MRLTTILLLGLISNGYFLYAQTSTINGIIKDGQNGETIIGATIKAIDTTGFVTKSNENGYYSLTLPVGKHKILVSTYGYSSDTFDFLLEGNLLKDFELMPKLKVLNEITVKGKKEVSVVKGAEIGVEKIDIKEINKIPVLLGEKDVIKTMQLLPGIKSGEGTAGFYVRGGAADQNLILLDEAPVYNASHLLGFFSTFNSDAIKDVSIYKGNIPAQYGGRLSSVLDIQMKNGSDKGYHASGGIGLISTRLNLEGPIVKNKGSFLLSGRRTYADLFLKLTDDFKDNKLYFYDLNLKANYKLNDKNQLFLSGYFGQDKLGLGESFGINWGNGTGTLRWKSILGSKWFMNTSFIVSNYNYKIGFNTNDSDVEITSTIQDYNIKQEFNFFPNTKNSIRFGYNSIYHTITPGQLSSTDESLNFTTLEDRHAWENSAFVSNDWKPNERVSINYGLRITSFSMLGKGNFYSYNDDGEVVDTTEYGSGEFVKTYINPEPRISMGYMLNSNSSIKLGYARNVQNLHLISNSTSSFPTDLWIASSNNVKPETADQIALGYFRNLKEDKYELSAETYYKYMKNQIDYRNGANTIANETIEGELLYGIGRAYGLEMMLKRKVGKLSGWISYTLSRTEKKIDGINENNWYLARQDRTHDIAVVGIYEINKKLSLSATWVFNTGQAVTFPSGKYELENKVYYSYTERNGERMPANHRLDVGLTWINKKTEKFESSWNFSVYNLYGRRNPYIISFEENGNKTEAVRTSLFRYVPSVTYNFKF